MAPELLAILQSSITYHEIAQSLKQQSSYWRGMLHRLSTPSDASPLPRASVVMVQAPPFLPLPSAAPAAPPFARYEVTDAQWALIAPLLANTARRGRPRADQRRTLNGVIYVLRFRCAWRRMPARYGSYVTCWRSLLHWQNNGIWRRLQTILDLPDEAPPAFTR